MVVGRLRNALKGRRQSVVEGVSQVRRYRFVVPRERIAVGHRLLQGPLTSYL